MLGIMILNHDVLDAYLFSDMEQVKIISDKWSEDYNENHPHGSLRGMSPRQYVRLNQEGFDDKDILRNLSKSAMSEKGKSSNDLLLFAYHPKFNHLINSRISNV